MQLNNIDFQFGKVKVNIASINTDKALISGELTIPILDGKLYIRFHKGIGWDESQRARVELDYQQIIPVEPEPEYEEDEEEGDNA